MAFEDWMATRHLIYEDDINFSFKFVLFYILFVFAETNEEGISSDLLMIPYSIQESTTPPENVSLLEPMTVSDSFEVQEVFPTKDETSPSDDRAEVKIEKLMLDEKETQTKSLFRRFVSFFCLVSFIICIRMAEICSLMFDQY